MNRTVRTSAIAEGAMMAGVTAVLSLISIYIPVSFVVIFLFWTIPTIIVTVKHGLLPGTMTVVVAGLLIFFFAGPVQAVLITLQFGGLGLVFGLSFKKGYHTGIAILIGVIASLVSVVIGGYLTYLVTGINPLNIVEQIRGSIEPTIEFYRTMGWFAPEKGFTEEATRQYLQAFIELMALIFPALIIISETMMVLFTYLVAQKVLTRWKINVHKIQPFSTWRLPWWVIWGLIAGLAANFIGIEMSISQLSIVGVNIILGMSFVFIIMGFSVVSYIIRRNKEKTIIYRILLIGFVIVFKTMALLLIALVGIVDLFANLRHLPDES